VTGLSFSSVILCRS